MSKIKSPAREVRGSLGQIGDAAYFPRFEVTNLREVTYGKIRWVFDLQVGPVTVECRIVADDDGRPRFTTPAQIKDAYSQTYRSTVNIERDFMEEVHRAAAAAIRGEIYPARRARTPDVDREAWAQDQEERFERAFAELEGAM